MNLHEHLTDTLDRIDETGPDLARMTAVVSPRRFLPDRRIVLRRALVARVRCLSVLCVHFRLLTRPVAGRAIRGPLYLTATA